MKYQPGMKLKRGDILISPVERKHVEVVREDEKNVFSKFEGASSKNTMRQRKSELEAGRWEVEQR